VQDGIHAEKIDPRSDLHSKSAPRPGDHPKRYFVQLALSALDHIRREDNLQLLPAGLASLEPDHSETGWTIDSFSAKGSERG